MVVDDDGVAASGATGDDIDVDLMNMSMMTMMPMDVCYDFQ
mgnify:CR=1 FL=1